MILSLYCLKQCSQRLQAPDLTLCNRSPVLQAGENIKHNVKINLLKIYFINHNLTLLVADYMIILEELSSKLRVLLQKYVVKYTANVCFQQLNGNVLILILS